MWIMAVLVGGTRERGVHSAWPDSFSISNGAMRSGSTKKSVRSFHSLIFFKSIFKREFRTPIGNYLTNYTINKKRKYMCVCVCVLQQDLAHAESSKISSSNSQSSR